MIANRALPRLTRGKYSTRIFYFAALTALLATLWPGSGNAQCPAPGGVCATASKDGAGGTLTGTLNSYYPGTGSPAAGTTSVTTGAIAANGAATAIAVNDLVLIIQMQGADITFANDDTTYGANNGTGSGYLTTGGNLTAGLYEFAKVSAVTNRGGGARTFTIVGGGTGTGLINSYVTRAFSNTANGVSTFQVVRVPQYSTATLSSGLTAGAWNGSTGGVLAIDVATTLTLNSATVSVSGLGFRGGMGQQLAGDTAGSGTAYRSVATKNFHGNKGEGIAGTPEFTLLAGAQVDSGNEGYPSGSRARGAPGNAGGGGTDPNPGANDENSGGGGGGNGGAGGHGGLAWDVQNTTYGIGGPAFAQGTACRIVMGGGGGSGSRNNSTGDALASSGSAGGGIIIIRTRFITGTATLTANGADAYQNTANDGGGGAGAGGTIVFSAIGGVLTGLTFQANGGRGGDTWDTSGPGDNGVDAGNNRHGPGGGGGGGYLFLSGAATSTSAAGGAHGTTTTAADTFGSVSGSAGSVSTSVTPDQIPGVFSGAQCTATIVKLDSFKAVGKGGKVLLKWKTGFETNNLGFHIYKDQGGERVRVNPSLIAGSALRTKPDTLLTAGWSYAWTDTSNEKGQSSRYWLEDIDLAGNRTLHGPIGVEPAAAEDEGVIDAQPRALLLSELRQSQKPNGVIEGPVEPTPEMEAATVKLARRSTKLATATNSLASRPAVKISVRNEGWYHLAKQDLVAAGLDPNADPRLLQLFLNGVEVPMSVGGSSSAYTLEFYGLAPNSPATDLNVYWLAAGTTMGQRYQTITSSSTAVGSPGNFTYTTQLAQRFIYFTGVLNGDKENFFGDPIESDSPTPESITVSHLDANAPDGTTVQVAIQGVSDLGHHIQVSVNGVSVGTVDFTGQNEGTGTFSLPRGVIKEGPNNVTFTTASDTDITLFDYIQVTYKHALTADNNALKFPVSMNQKVTVGGFTNSSIRVVDITDPKTPREITGGKISQGASGFSISFAPGASDNRTLYAFTSDRANAAAALDFNQPSSWRSPSNGADLVIITRSMFSASLNQLVTLRQNQGLAVSVIDAVDLYDEFSFGQKTPQAFKDFLSYATSNWARKPRFVLLAGKATYDPKNYLGEGNFDFVPTKLIDTKEMETGSDDWFVDPAGTGFPTIPIGRLPARTAQEMTGMVGKIVKYENTAQTGGAVLVTDLSDDYDFAAATQQVRLFLPGTLNVISIDRNSPTAKTDMLAAINQGQRIVNYVGHGSVDLWRGSLLTDDDAATLTNGQNLPLFVTMTCLNGYFIDPALDSLAEALLNAPNGGTAAMWASSGITEPGSQSVMNQNFYMVLFGNQGITIGEATVRAKNGVADPDVRRTWILFGDPSMKLK